MDTNNYFGWLDNVLVAYLNHECPQPAVLVEGRVPAYCSDDILFSMEKLAAVFGAPGQIHFKKWFNCDTGSQDKGLTRARITTSRTKRQEVLAYLEMRNLMDVVRQDKFSFVAFEMHWRKRHQENLIRGEQASLENAEIYRVLSEEGKV